MNYYFFCYAVDATGRHRLPGKLIKLKTWKGVANRLRRYPEIDMSGVENRAYDTYFIEKCLPDNRYGKPLSTTTIKLGYFY